jgi:ABC-type multidrug transport system ATPase subunit
MSQSFLEIKDVQVLRAGNLVLDVPSLSAPAGTITVVTGENGAGKTTLLLAAAGLLDLARGQVDLLGEAFHRGKAPAPRRMRRQVAFVFQDPYLFNRSVRSNLTYGLKIRGVARTERRMRAGEVLERLGISALADRPANDLSGGERKLVAVGRAMILTPKVLFLDEVTASLDDEAREKVLTLIRTVLADGNTNVMMATHMEGIAKSLAARNIVLNNGRIASVSEPDS